jgi:hypothetical protein
MACDNDRIKKYFIAMVGSSARVFSKIGLLVLSLKSTHTSIKLTRTSI